MGGRWRRNCRDRRSQLAKHIWSSPEVAVLDIDDAPSTLKPKPVRVAIAAAAAMVHVEHTNAASRPVLRRKRERARCGRRRTLHDSLPGPAPFRLPAPQTRAKTADSLGIARASVYRASEAG
jgi:hypothetical protein